MNPVPTTFRRIAATVFALLMITYGYVIASAGFHTVISWESIRGAYAACAATWVITGPIMFAAGLWTFVSRGRRRSPLWIGGAATMVAGTALVAGVLTKVIPCSGPS